MNTDPPEPSHSGMQDGSAEVGNFAELVGRKGSESSAAIPGARPDMLGTAALLITINHALGNPLKKAVDTIMNMLSPSTAEQALVPESNQEKNQI